MTVGAYTTDHLAEDQVIVEPEVVGAPGDVHMPQRPHDLQAIGKPL
jgi:hypothetical protein